MGLQLAHINGYVPSIDPLFTVLRRPAEASSPGMDLRTNKPLKIH